MRARLLAAIALAAWAPPATSQDAPREIGLVERSGRRLAQIDISAFGPPEIVCNLTADDFRIKVRLERISAFELDRHCTPPPPAGTPPDETDAPTSGAATATATFMLYFDQPHLTLGGRSVALGLARDLVTQLVRDGNQAMIVSNNRELLIVEPLTSDAARLLAGLDRLEADRMQYDTFAEQEDERVAEVARTLSDQWDQTSASVDRATSVARRYQVEEVWRAERSMRRLSMTLQRLSETPPPKAVLYFADTLRSNPGEHYLSFFGQRMRDTRVALLNIASDALMARSPFDRVITEAVGLGIRFYPVLARGMGSDLDSVMPSASAISRGGGSPMSSRARHQQARESLATLASETGGEAFVHGQRAPKVAERVERDFGCLYVASFDPGDLPEDAPLRITVSTTREGVELRNRGQLVLLSESARTTARLLNAFAETGDPGGPAERVRASVVPTGFRERRFTALLQITAPGLPLPAATWDLGASVIRDQKVVTEISGRMAVAQPHVAVVYEAELEFKHGDYEIVAVAHELSTGIVASHRLRVSWPDPAKHAATVTPIALLQPAVGAFLRSEHKRLAGSLAHDAAEPVLTDRATALVGLVCHDTDRDRTLEVARRLVGETTVDFPPLSLELGQEQCAQVRDLVPSGGLGEGYYRYEVLVSAAGETLFRGAREFLAVAPSR